MKYTLILSPHFDDAMLSCGEYILQEVKKNRRVIILNIFTNFASKTQTKFVSKQLKKIGLTPNEYKKLREAEDQKAWKNISVVIKNLNYTDAGFRTEKNKPTYPTAQQLFSKKLNSQENKIIQDLSLQLSCLTKKIKITNIVLPIGVGDHIDHIIVKRAAEKAWNINQLCYYLDQPYFIKRRLHKLIQLILKLFFRVHILRSSIQKTKRLEKYKSQIAVLFKKNETLLFNEVLLEGTFRHSVSKNRVLQFLLRL